MTHSRISVRLTTYRGKPGWSITGRDSRDRKVSIFLEDEEWARRVADGIRAGDGHIDLFAYRP